MSTPVATVSEAWMLCERSTLSKGLAEERTHVTKRLISFATLWDRCRDLG
jgi:hypothetical protein